MSVVNQQTGGSVNDDNAAVVAAADQLDAEGSIVQSYERLKKISWWIFGALDKAVQRS